MDEKEHHETIHEYHSHVSGLLSSKTKDLYEAGKTDTVRGSLISGNETHMESGRDMTITGSAVISSKDATLLAGRNFKADSAEERSGSTYRESVKKRGLLSGGGLGFTMGSEKRKDRYDSEAIEQVGSTIGSVEGSVYIGAGKNAAILGSEVTAGKDISISGENINLQHTENTYSSLEKDEMARSGLSVSLGGRTVETVHSIAAPLMRAGEVEDARLKGLYALQAGQTAGQLIREEKDAGYVVESLRHNASESANMWEKARDWDRADRIENSRLGKKNSFALDIALGSGKSTSEIESTAHVIKGSMIHGENTVSVRADKDISVSGSRIEGKDVNLEAGRHILITAGENSTEEKQNTHSTSGNMGVSLGVEGIQGIRGGYSSGKGKEEETSRTYEDSWIKADNTLNFVSGKDTAVKGGKLEGDRVKGGVGGSLSLETVQDEKSYHEESHFAGITLSYDFSHGKSGLSGGLSKENIQSHYESASSQSGIYAGDEGFDISVKDNTHLKGAVIDSKGSVDKNTLRTGTLSWEDIENKAGYESGGMGISYAPKDSTTPLNARGLTPQMSPTVKDKAGSTTKAAIAKGTIIITNKKNQNQDISTLNRDTETSLNKLKEIFDKSKVEGKQELIQKVSQLGNEAIHAVSDHYGWKEGSSEKMLLHGALGALIGSMSGGSSLSGALSGSVNEFAMGYLEKTKGKEWMGKHPDAVQAVSMALGAAIGGSAGDGSIGAYMAQTGTKWNYLGFELLEFGDLLIRDLKNPDGTPIKEEQAKQLQDDLIINGNKWDVEGATSNESLEIGNNYALIGITLLLKNKYAPDSVDRLMSDYKKMAVDKQNEIKKTGTIELRPLRVSADEAQKFDAYLVQGGIGAFELGYTYDFKTGRSYFSRGTSLSKAELPISLEIAGLRIISNDDNYNLWDSRNRENILSGNSVGGSVYLGLGGGVSTPLGDTFGKIWVYKYGVGLPQVGVSVDHSDPVNDEDKDE
nr:hemagglutinin repeat-containing protein [uncultured Dialister sp.]